jgi:DNA-binding CsgD family transcriptional regulator
LLGKAYFDLLRDLESADAFAAVVQSLGRGLPPLIGAHSCFVVETARGEGLRQVHGAGRIPDLVREQRGEINRILMDHPVIRQIDLDQPGELGKALQDFLSPEACRTSALNACLPPGLKLSDALVGKVFSCCRRTALLFTFSDRGCFAVRERELFDAILFTTRAVLGRIAGQGVEKAVRHFIMKTAGRPVAVFAVRPDGQVLPISHEAVRYAEAAWAMDEPTRTLAPEVHERLREALLKAWADPVTAAVEPLEINFGDGPMACHALPKADGEMLVFMPTGGVLPSGEEALKAVLTRRQREIMHWIAEGKTSAEAAVILEISPRTVEKHLEAVFQRLGVENRISAVRRYLDLKSGQAT